VRWHGLDHMQTICTSLQTDNYTNTSLSLNFYKRVLFLTPNQQCQRTEGNTTQLLIAAHCSYRATSVSWSNLNTDKTAKLHNYQIRHSHLKITWANSKCCGQLLQPSIIMHLQLYVPVLKPFHSYE